MPDRRHARDKCKCSARLELHDVRADPVAIIIEQTSSDENTIKPHHLYEQYEQGSMRVYGVLISRQRLFTSLCNHPGSPQH